MRIANDLLFRVPITVNFTVGKDERFSTYEEPVLMESSPFMIAGTKKHPDRLVSFPSALAKQTILNLPKLPFDSIPEIQDKIAPYDITILVNSDQIENFDTFPVYRASVGRGNFDCAFH